MSYLTTLLSAETMHSLGWALVHFLWQGTALAAVAAGAMSLSRRASTRYVVAVAALVLMFLAPIATLYWQTQTADDSATMGATSAPVHTFLQKSQTAAVAVLSTAQNKAPSPDLLLWLAEVWLVGVVFFSLRSAGGFWLLERKRRKASTPLSGQLLEMCQALQRRMGLRRAIEFCQCKWLEAPAVIGWFRPVVFIPASVLTGLSESQLRAVIAHELAHIQRLDAFVNVFQIATETLLFYHPAVWWLNQRIRAERENCCDDAAVSVCADPIEYARALALMEEWRSAPAFAMALNGTPLKQRVMRLLGSRASGAETRRMGVTGSVLCLVAALVAGNAFLGIAYPKATVQAALFQSPHFALETLRSSQAKPSRSAAASPASPAAKPSPVVTPAAEAEPTPVTALSPQSAAAPSGSYIESMKAAGLKDLSIDDLIALKVQDVTPQYVHDIQALGLHPNAQELVAMKVQDITPQYIRGVHDLGLQPDLNGLIAMKVQDVDADYIQQMAKAGIKPDVNELIALKVQDVTPDYISKIRATGLQPTTQEVVALKVQDVTPEYIHAMQALGLKLNVEQVIAMKVQDVTPEFVKAMRNSGVSGFGDNPDPYIAAKVQDITQTFVDEAVKHGFKNLNINKLMQLKNLGILESPASI